jgi:hypothetical protein
MSQAASLNVSSIGFSTSTFNLSGNSALNLQNVFQADLRVNLRGGDEHLFFNLRAASIATIDLARNTTWHGAFSSGSFAVPILTVNGGRHSVFDNEGTSTVAGLSDVQINTDVGGAGNFDVHSKLEFGGAVGKDQHITLNSLNAGDEDASVRIDHPASFLGSVTMNFIPPPQPNSPQHAPEIDLVGMTTADSFFFVPGLLVLFAGNRPIDLLRLGGSMPDGFEVDRTPRGVNIVALSEPPIQPRGLPVHF